MSSTVAVPPAESIDEVIARLDTVVAESVRDGSRLGLFACLYRGVTVRVRDGIRAGEFEDGPRMERFDVIFANRYLAALAASRRGEFPGRSWGLAFEAARSGRLLILQHLLLGMNAHINLDLGVAAAHTAPGASLGAMRTDFFTITRILGDMMDNVQQRINAVSPWMGVVDRIGCRNDEEVFFFCLARAPHGAWWLATCLADATADRVPLEIDRVDRVAALVGKRIRRPGLHLAPALLCVRARESTDVAEVLHALS